METLKNINKAVKVVEQATRKLWAIVCDVDERETAREGEAKASPETGQALALVVLLVAGIIFALVVLSIVQNSAQWQMLIATLQ